MDRKGPSSVAGCDIPPPSGGSGVHPRVTVAEPRDGSGELEVLRRELERIQLERDTLLDRLAVMAEQLSPRPSSNPAAPHGEVTKVGEET